eukprot:2459620-Pyramimonas_sp.AAC.1
MLGRRHFGGGQVFMWGRHSGFRHPNAPRSRSGNRQDRRAARHAAGGGRSRGSGGARTCPAYLCA